MSYRKDLFKMVKEMGWEVAGTCKSGHYKLRKPGVGGTVIASASPTNAHQVLKSVARDMRRVEAES